MGIPLQTVEFVDNSGGLNLKSSPTKVPEDEASLSLNIDYSTDGAFRTRLGSKIQNVDSNFIPIQMDQLRTLGLYDYRRSDGVATQVVAAGIRIKHGLNTPTTQSNASTGAGISLSPLLPIPDLEFQVTNSEELLFYGNGVNTNLKYDGSIWSNWSYIKCPDTFTVTAIAAGTLLVGTYNYYISFGRIIAGVLVQEGELSNLKTVAVAAGQRVSFTNIPTRTDANDLQVNARIIYRSSNAAGFSGQVRRLAIIPDGTTTVYVDDDPAEGPILAQFDNEFIRSATSVSSIPKTSIFEEYLGRMFVRDEENKTDLYYSKFNTPFNVPEENVLIFDGEIRCVKRFYGALIIGTDRSLWVLNGDPEIVEPRRVSSVIGIYNNRCAVGESYLYILGSNKKFYRLNPTDFSQSEIRFEEPDSIKIEPLISQIGNSNDGICMAYYTGPNVSKVYLCVPLGTGDLSNNSIIIYNETQSILKSKPTWQLWDNLNVSALSLFNINGDIGIYSGDYNGFLWRLEDPSIYGDGAAINGAVTSIALPNFLISDLLFSTASSGTLTTLADTSQNMTVNQYAGKYIIITAGTGAVQQTQIIQNSATVFTVNPPFTIAPDNTSVYQVGPFSPMQLKGCSVRIISGTGAGQLRTVSSNTATTLFTTQPFNPIPDTTSQFTVGGYRVYHYSNWKRILVSYDVLKQMWFFWVNANSNGDYNIELLIQTDFNQDEVAATTLLLNLSAQNTTWGEFIWGEAPWGARAVFQDRLRAFKRFRSIRFGFRNYKAGQPFQINAFSLSSQNKQLFFRSI